MSSQSPSQGNCCCQWGISLLATRNFRTGCVRLLLLMLGVFQGANSLEHLVAQDDVQDPAHEQPTDEGEQPSDERPVRRSRLAIDPVDSATLEKFISQLGDASYQRRQVAMRHLVSAGEAAIPFLEKAVQGGDLELVDRASMILQDLATLETPTDKGEAWAALARLQQMGPGAAASRAMSARATIQNERSQRASARLNAAGVATGIHTFTLASRSAVAELVYFPADWTSDKEALAWLPWLYSTTTAIVEGDALTEDVMAGLAAMPSLRELQLLDGELDAQALSQLQKLKRIDTLEINFVSLGKAEEDLFALAELPLRQRLILMGTEFDEEDVAALKTQLKGLEIIHGRGGFLGVQCALGAIACEVDLVVPESAADRAGVQQGDVIVRLGEHPIQRFADLQENVRKYSPKSEMDLVVRRRGNQLTLKINLGRQINPFKVAK